WFASSHLRGGVPLGGCLSHRLIGSKCPAISSPFGEINASATWITSLRSEGHSGNSRVGAGSVAFPKGSGFAANSLGLVLDLRKRTRSVFRHFHRVQPAKNYRTKRTRRMRLGFKKAVPFTPARPMAGPLRPQ